MGAFLFSPDGCCCGVNLHQDVWGVRTPESWHYDSSEPAATFDISEIYPDWYQAVKVSSKYAPFVNNNGTVAAREFPPADSGPEVSLRMDFSMYPDSIEERRKYLPPEDQWAVNLVPPAHTILTVNGNSSIKDTSRVHSSRAVYIDGVQTHILYQLQPTQEYEFFQFQYSNQINIETKESVVVDYHLSIGGYNGFLEEDFSNPILGENYSWSLVPNSWYISTGYFVTSTYDVGSVYWNVKRTKITSTNNGIVHRCYEVGLSANLYNIIMPTLRAYLRSDVEDDEPWVIARAFPNGIGGNQKIVTGRWHNSEVAAGGGNEPLAILTAEEQENVLVDSDELPYLDVLCYNRIRSTDLAIFVYPEGNDGNGAYYYYDGNSVNYIETGETPTFITMDSNDRIIYGNHYFIRALGSNGWAYTGVSYTPDGSSLPNVSTKSFQILTNKNWIQLRSFWGSRSDASEFYNFDTTTSGIGLINGLEYSHDTGILLEETSPTCWNFSYDGNIRVPHIWTKGYYAAPVSFEREYEGIGTFTCYLGDPGEFYENNPHPTPFFRFFTRFYETYGYGSSLPFIVFDEFNEPPCNQNVYALLYSEPANKYYSHDFDIVAPEDETKIPEVSFY